MSLVAIMDWHTHKALSWRISSTLEPDYCVEASEESLERYGAPEIFNTDHGVQFTSQAFTGVLNEHGRQGPVAGQRVRRATVAQREVRRRVSSRAAPFNSHSIRKVGPRR